MSVAVYVHDYKGTRQQLFEEMLAAAKEEAAESARKIRHNLAKGLVQIDPSCVLLFGVKTTRERVEKILFRR